MGVRYSLPFVPKENTFEMQEVLKAVLVVLLWFIGVRFLGTETLKQSGLEFLPMHLQQMFEEVLEATPSSTLTSGRWFHTIGTFNWTDQHEAEIHPHVESHPMLDANLVGPDGHGV